MKRLVKIVIVKQISNFEIKEVSEDIDFLSRIKTADYNGLLYFFTLNWLSDLCVD